MSGGYDDGYKLEFSTLPWITSMKKILSPTLVLRTEFFWVQLILKGRYLLKRTVFINSTNSFDNYDALLS